MTLAEHKMYCVRFIQMVQAVRAKNKREKSFTKAKARFYAVHGYAHAVRLVGRNAQAFYKYMGVA